MEGVAGVGTGQRQIKLLVAAALVIGDLQQIGSGAQALRARQIGFGAVVAVAVHNLDPVQVDARAIVRGQAELVVAPGSHRQGRGQLDGKVFRHGHGVGMQGRGKAAFGHRQRVAAPAIGGKANVGKGGDIDHDLVGVQVVALIGPAARVARQGVVACAAGQGIGARAAQRGQAAGVGAGVQNIVAARQGDGFDAVKAGGQARRRRAARAIGLRDGQRPGDPVDQQRIVIGAARQGIGARRAGLEQQVVARARIDAVIARAAQHQVIAGAADQGVVTGAARQKVMPVAAVDPVGPVFADDKVAARAGLDVVIAIAAIDQLVAGIDADRIRAAAPVDTGDLGVAGKAVVFLAQREVFDVGQHVAGRIAALFGQAIGQVDGDGGRGAVDRKVDAIAAIQRVGPGAAVQRILSGARSQDVVARATDKVVVTAIAGQRVVAGPSRQVFDRRQNVARRLPSRGSARAKVDVHSGGIAAIERAVGARAAVQRIGANVAFQEVVTVAASDAVVAFEAAQVVVFRVPGQGVVAGAGPDLFDARQDVTLRRSAAAHAGGQVHGQIDGIKAVFGAVDAIAADQRIGARVTAQGVVAIARVDQIGAVAATDVVGLRRAGQRVIAAAAPEVFKPGKDVALRIAPAGGAGLQVDRNTRGVRGIMQPVDTRTTIQRVGPGVARDDIAAVPTRNAVVARVAVQSVA